VRQALTGTVKLQPPFPGRPPVPDRAAGDRADVGRQYRRHHLLMGLTDTLAVLAALLAASSRLAPTLDLRLLGAGAVITPAVHLTMGLYRAHQLSTAEELRRILVAVSLVVPATAMASCWSPAALSRTWMLWSWALGLALALSVRRLWHRQARRARRNGRLTFRTLIVGANLEAEHLAATMRARELGFLPVGFVTGGRDELRLEDPRVVGPVGRLRELVRETGADCLFVVASAVTPDDVAQVMKARRQADVEVRFTANLPAVLSSRLAPQAIGDVLALAVTVPQLTRLQAAAKRACDVVLAAAGLLALAPLFAVVALAVRATSRGPVLFRQQRVGFRGRPFTLLKFRTMVDGADRMLGALLDRNEADGPLFKLRRDPRVTRVGAVLRRHSLDELPQLWNVLKGEMSLVGPRPPLPAEVERYEEWQHDRLEVRPGITGLWQVSGRSELSFDDYVRLDLFYVENWSVAYDLYILSKTVPLLVSARGAW
jgi:exopolysaccharide biosynthesis polyprenyl glycosylphosphotransferase